MKAISAILFYILGIFQLFAIMDGLDVWLGLSSLASFMIGILLAYMPIVGTVVGMCGAVSAWDCSWLQAIGLFFGPLILIVVMVYIATIFDRADVTDNHLRQ